MLVDDAVFGVDHGLIACPGSRRRVALRLQADPRHGPCLLALSCPVYAIYSRPAHTETSRPMLSVADQMRAIDGGSAHPACSAESLAARPTPGVHSPSPALQRSWTARAARACSAALRPAHRLRRAGRGPGAGGPRGARPPGALGG